MSETVFLSGSRKISRLNDRIRARLDRIVEKGLRVVVGDANGADKALQAWLAERDYRDVTVFCAAGQCRNNLGHWPERAVPVPPGVKGRDFFTVKDVAMAAEADYGLVLWDTKSVGSINNVLELVRRGKRVVVYVAPKQEFRTLRDPADVPNLLTESAPEDRAEIETKARVGRKLREAAEASQGALSLE